MADFNENDCLRHIKNYLKHNSKTVLPSDDLILEIVDSMWDAYEELGFLDIDFNDDFDEEKVYAQEQEERRQVIDYVLQHVEAVSLDKELASMIFDAETEYEETLL